MAADFRKLARQMAKRHGLDPNVFERQIGAESGFNPNARSPAGASGIAQIMPATARGWGVNPADPKAALNAAAKNMAGYVKKYGSYENALRAYNAGPGAIERSKGYAETNNYVAKILGGRDPGKLDAPSSGGGAPSSTGSPSQRTTTTTGLDEDAFEDAKKKAIVGQLLARRNPNSALLRLGVLPTTAPDPAQFQSTTTKTVRSVSGQRDTGRTRRDTGGGDTANLKPGGGYAGTEGIIRPLAQLAHKLGVSTSSAKRGTVNTASGNVSDHYVGNKRATARDFSNGSSPTPQMDRLAKEYQRRLGFKDYKGVQNVTKTIGGQKFRFQMLWRTEDHYDHVHLGVKKVG